MAEKDIPKPNPAEAPKLAPNTATVTKEKLEEMEKETGPILVKKTQELAGRSKAWDRAGFATNHDALLDNGSDKQIKTRREALDEKIQKGPAGITYTQLLEDGNDLRTQKIRGAREQIQKLGGLGAIDNIEEKQKLVDLIDGWEGEIVQRRLFNAGITAYLNLSGMYEKLKGPGWDPPLTFDPALEKTALQHMAHLHAHMDQRVRLAAEYDIILREEKILKETGQDIPPVFAGRKAAKVAEINKCTAYINDLMQCDSSTSVPGANAFGMLPFQALLQKALEDENVAIVEKYKQLGKIPLSDEKDPKHAEFLAATKILQKRSRQVCLFTEQIGGISGRVNGLRISARGALLLRQGGGGFDKKSHLRKESDAALDRLDNSLRKIEDLTSRKPDGSEDWRFADDIAERTAHLNKAGAAGGPEGVYEWLANQGGQAGLDVRNQWKKLGGEPLGTRDWTTRSTIILDAMGWPRHPNGKPKKLMEMTPEERKRMEDKKKSYGEALKNFNAGTDGREGGLSPATYLRWTIELQKKLQSDPAWDPQKLAEEYADKEPPDVSKLKLDDRLYAAVNGDAKGLEILYGGDKRLVLLHIYAQLHRDWNSHMERCTAFQQSVHDIIGIHYSVSAGEEYARKMQRQMESVFDASEHVLYALGVMAVRAQMQQYRIGQKIASAPYKVASLPFKGVAMGTRLGTNAAVDLFRMARWGKEAMQAGQLTREMRGKFQFNKEGKLLRGLDGKPIPRTAPPKMPPKPGGISKFAAGGARLASKAAVVAGIAGELIDPIFDGIETIDAKRQFQKDKADLDDKFTKIPGITIDVSDGKNHYVIKQGDIEIRLDRNELQKGLDGRHELAKANLRGSAAIGAVAIGCMFIPGIGWIGAAIIVGVSLLGKWLNRKLNKKAILEEKWAFFYKFTGNNHWILELLYGASKDTKGVIRTNLLTLLGEDEDEKKENFQQLFEGMEKYSNNGYNRTSLVLLEMSAELRSEDPVLLAEMHGLHVNPKSHEQFESGSKEIFLRALERLSGVGYSAEGANLNAKNRNQWKGQLRRAAYITVMHIREMRYRGLYPYSGGGRKGKEMLGEELLFGRRLSEYNALFAAEKTYKTIVQRAIERGDDITIPPEDMPERMPGLKNESITFRGSERVDSWWLRDDPLLTSGKLRSYLDQNYMKFSDQQRKAMRVYCSMLENREFLRRQHVDHYMEAGSSEWKYSIPWPEAFSFQKVLSDPFNKIADPEKRAEFMKASEDLKLRKGDLDGHRGRVISSMEGKRVQNYVAAGQKIDELAGSIFPLGAQDANVVACENSAKEIDQLVKDTYENVEPDYLNKLDAYQNDCGQKEFDLENYLAATKRAKSIVDMEKRPIVARSGMRAAIPDFPTGAYFGATPNVDMQRDMDAVTELVSSLDRLKPGSNELLKGMTLDGIVIDRVAHNDEDQFLMTVRFAKVPMADRGADKNYDANAVTVECGLIRRSDGGLELGNFLMSDSASFEIAWDLSEKNLTEEQRITTTAVNIVEKDRRYVRSDELGATLLSGTNCPVYIGGDVSALDGQDGEAMRAIGAVPEPERGWKRSAVYIESTDDPSGARHIAVTQLEYTVTDKPPRTCQWRTRSKAVVFDTNGDMRTGDWVLGEGLGHLEQRDRLRKSLNEARSTHLRTIVAMDRQRTPPTDYRSREDIQRAAFGGNTNVVVTYANAGLNLADPLDAEAVKKLAAFAPKETKRAYFVRTVVGGEISYLGSFETEGAWHSIGAVRTAESTDLMMGDLTVDSKGASGFQNLPPKEEKVPEDIRVVTVPKRPEMIIPAESLHAKTTGAVHLARMVRRYNDGDIWRYNESLPENTGNEGSFTVKTPKTENKNIQVLTLNYDHDGVRADIRVECKGLDLNLTKVMDALRTNPAAVPLGMTITGTAQWDGKPEGRWKFLAECSPAFLVAMPVVQGSGMDKLLSLPLDPLTLALPDASVEEMKKALGGRYSKTLQQNIEKAAALRNFITEVRRDARGDADIQTVAQILGQGDLADVIDTLKWGADILLSLRTQRIEDALARRGKQWKDLDAKEQDKLISYANYEALALARSFVMQRQFDALEKTTKDFETTDPTSKMLPDFQNAYNVLSQNPWQPVADVQEIIDGKASVQKLTFGKILHQFDPAMELAMLAPWNPAAMKKRLAPKDYVYEYQGDKVANAEEVCQRRFNALKAIVEMQTVVRRPLNLPSDLPDAKDVPDGFLQMRMKDMKERGEALRKIYDGSRQPDATDMAILEKMYTDTNAPYAAIEYKNVAVRTGQIGDEKRVMQLDKGKDGSYEKAVQEPLRKAEEKQIADMFKRIGNPQKGYAASLEKWEKDSAALQKELLEYRKTTVGVEAMHSRSALPWRAANRLAGNVFSSNQASVILAGNIDVERDLPILQKVNERLEAFGKDLGRLDDGPPKIGDDGRGAVRHVTVSRIAMPDGSESFFVTCTYTRATGKSNVYAGFSLTRATTPATEKTPAKETVTEGNIFLMKKPHWRVETQTADAVRMGDGKGERENVLRVSRSLLSPQQKLTAYIAEQTLEQRVAKELTLPQKLFGKDTSCGVLLSDNINQTTDADILEAFKAWPPLEPGVTPKCLVIRKVELPGGERYATATYLATRMTAQRDAVSGGSPVQSAVEWVVTERAGEWWKYKDVREAQQQFTNVSAFAPVAFADADSVLGIRNYMRKGAGEELLTDRVIEQLPQNIERVINDNEQIRKVFDDFMNRTDSIQFLSASTLNQKDLDILKKAFDYSGAHKSKISGTCVFVQKTEVQGKTYFHLTLFGQDVSGKYTVRELVTDGVMCTTPKQSFLDRMEAPNRLRLLTQIQEILNVGTLPSLPLSITDLDHPAKNFASRRLSGPPPRMTLSQKLLPTGQWYFQLPPGSTVVMRKTVYDRANPYTKAKLEDVGVVNVDASGACAVDPSKVTEIAVWKPGADRAKDPTCIIDVTQEYVNTGKNDYDKRGLAEQLKAPKQSGSFERPIAVRNGATEAKSAEVMVDRLPNNRTYLAFDDFSTIRWNDGGEDREIGGLGGTPVPGKPWYFQTPGDFTVKVWRKDQNPQKDPPYILRVLKKPEAR